MKTPGTRHESEVWNEMPPPDDLWALMRHESADGDEMMTAGYVQGENLWLTTMWDGELKLLDPVPLSLYSGWTAVWTSLTPWVPFVATASDPAEVDDDDDDGVLTPDDDDGSIHCVVFGITPLGENDMLFLRLRMRPHNETGGIGFYRLAARRWAEWERWEPRMIAVDGDPAFSAAQLCEWQTIEIRESSLI